MRNCQQIAEVRSQGCDCKLKVRDRFSLWLHARLCKCEMCNGLQTHLVMLRETVQGAYVEVETRMAQVTLDEQARERIKSQLIARRDELAAAERTAGQSGQQEADRSAGSA